MMPIFSTRGNSYAIDQAASGFSLNFRTSAIKRINGERVMKAQCDPQRCVNTLELTDKLTQEIKNEIAIPQGYQMKLVGEEESRDESNKALAKYLPLTLILIFTILLLLFNSYRDTLVITLTIPLIFIGVVGGLLISGKPIDFFSLLGLLGLIGMNVKNAVILVARINELRASGVEPQAAIIRAAADRFTPVVTASGTTVLGLIPLLFDPMFGSMAVTIMGGLVVATILVLLLLPVIYSLFYRIRI
jgi:multidrug efflux pump subunit AcrB